MFKKKKSAEETPAPKGIASSQIRELIAKDGALYIAEILARVG